MGDMQRAFQTIRELIYNQNEEKKEQMLKDFSVHNKSGVDSAIRLMRAGFFTNRAVRDITVEEVFDALMDGLDYRGEVCV